MPQQRHGAGKGCVAVGECCPLSSWTGLDSPCLPHCRLLAPEEVGPGPSSASRRGGEVPVGDRMVNTEACAWQECSVPAQASRERAPSEPALPHRFPRPRLVRDLPCPPLRLWDAPSFVCLEEGRTTQTLTWRLLSFPPAELGGAGPREGPAVSSGAVPWGCRGTGARRGEGSQPQTLTVSRSGGQKSEFKVSQGGDPLDAPGEGPSEGPSRLFQLLRPQVPLGWRSLLSGSASVVTGLSSVALSHISLFSSEHLS